MRTFKFYKEPTNRWYVELPEWTGSKAELEMIAGADTFLDIIAQGDHEVYLTLSTTPFEGAEVLTLKNLGKLESWELGEGAWYHLDKYKSIPFNLRMWLCDVTKFIFNEFPNKIYFS